MQISTKLRRASIVMSWISLTAAAVLFVAVPLAFLVPNPTIRFSNGMVLAFVADNITTATPLAYRAVALLIATIPVGLGIWMLITLFRLFQFYANGQVFDATAIKHLNRVTVLLFWVVLALKLSEAGQSALLGWVAGKPGLQVSLSLTTVWFSYVFIAGVALVIARAMQEAQRLADENATFV